eukprot:6129844-Amphidinium_carterae.1
MLNELHEKNKDKRPDLLRSWERTFVVAFDNDLFRGFTCKSKDQTSKKPTKTWQRFSSVMRVLEMDVYAQMFCDTLAKRVYFAFPISLDAQIDLVAK